MARKKKLIFSGRLGDSLLGSYRTSEYVIRWITRRLHRWRTIEHPLAIKPLSNQDAQASANPLAFVEKEWRGLVERWDALHSAPPVSDEQFRWEFQDLSRRLRLWLDDRLTDEERARLLNALRQHRYQERNSKKIAKRTITVRVDRSAYEAAMSGLPERQKATIVSRLLHRFANDEALRFEILGQ